MKVVPLDEVSGQRHPMRCRLAARSPDLLDRVRFVSEPAVIGGNDEVAGAKAAPVAESGCIASVHFAVYLPPMI